MMVVAMVMLQALLLGIGLIDLKHYKIYNWSLVILMVVALIATQGKMVTFENLMGALLVITCLWLPYQYKWLGAGDIKLLAIVSMLLPQNYKVLMLLSVFVLGGLWCAIFTVRRQGKRWSLKKRVNIPYGLPIVAIGMVGVLL